MRDRLNPPRTTELTKERLHELRKTVLTEITEQSSAAHRRLRAIPATVLILVFATATAAGAAIFLRQEFDPSTEVLQAERAEAIARLGADIPLPPGGSFDALLEVDYTEDEKGLAASLAFNAWCQWTGLWLQGALDQEPNKSAEALAVMEEVPSWPQLTEVDGGGVIAGLEAVVAFARGGDVDDVALHYATNCIGMNAELDAAVAPLSPPASAESATPADSTNVTATCETLLRVLADASASESADEVVAALQEAAEVAAAGIENEHLTQLFTTASESRDPQATLASLHEEVTTVCETSS